MRVEPRCRGSDDACNPASGRRAAAAAMRRHDGASRQARRRQCGQALAESLVLLSVLAALVAAVALLGEWQWQALRAACAGRALAFRIAAGQRPPEAAAMRGGGVTARAWRLSSGAAQGRQASALGRLRQEWAGPRDGIWQAAASATVAPGGRAWSAGRHLDVAASPLNRHTAVLVGPGHASGDAHAQRRIAASHTAWRGAAQPSLQAGRAVATRLRGVDRGWKRPAPHFDWLRPWHDLVPANRLQGQGPQRGPAAAAARLKDGPFSGTPVFGRVSAAPRSAP